MTEKLQVNHKGEYCIIDWKLCQEGYCIECEIYNSSELLNLIRLKGRSGVVDKVINNK
jgi:hypothetical protein